MEKDNKIENVDNILEQIYVEEEESSVEVAASLSSLSTVGTATGCASSAGTVATYG